jgi:hypothetical protein
MVKGDIYFTGQVEVAQPVSRGLEKFQYELDIFYMGMSHRDVMVRWISIDRIYFGISVRGSGAFLSA